MTTWTQRTEQTAYCTHSGHYPPQSPSAIPKAATPNPSELPGHRSWSRRHFLALTGAATSAAAASVLWPTPQSTAASTEASAAASTTAGGLLVGRGIADVTGEPLGAGMNGYAVPEQTSIGIQRRQYARAFIFADPARANDPTARVCHITVDTGLMFQSVHLEVIRRLHKNYGDLYGEHNVLVHATHTHVAPGGTSQHLMVDLVTLGFRPVTFEAQVSGILHAVQRAHADVQPSEVTLTETSLADAGRNRSIGSWRRNPAADRETLAEGVDPRSVTLHVARNGREVGLINWHSLHPTSLPAEYRYISGDNKGYAAWSTEVEHGVDHRHPEAAGYVAAFANASPGDITPNHGLAPGTGPGKDATESSRILGQRTREAARRSNAATPLGGIVASTYRWVDCADLTVDGAWTADGAPGRTGPAVLGAAFAASSQEDGGGEPALGLNEGARGGNPWLRELGKVVVPKEIAAIHAPKDVLLPLGYIDGMIQQTHSFHINRIGGLILVSLGFEPTVTAGLRLRRTVAAAMDVPLHMVVVQGYTNGYGHYLTTPEEYEAQNYEGGATAFGRNQLPAFQQVFHTMATDIAAGRQTDAGAPAGDLTGMIPTSVAAAPYVDQPPLGKRFGELLANGVAAEAWMRMAPIPAPDTSPFTDPTRGIRSTILAEETTEETTESGHGRGAGSVVTVGEIAKMAFVGANPNNNLRHGTGYIAIRNAAGEVVAHDSSENTLLTFLKSGFTVTTVLEWDTADVPPGRYEVTYSADSRGFTGAITPFEGVAVVNVKS